MMEHITSRDQLRALLSKLQGISLQVNVRGTAATNNGYWGRQAEGDAAVGLINNAAIEKYVILKIDNTTPVAEVNLADVITWAGSPDPKQEKRISAQADEIAALRSVIAAHDQRLIAGADGTDPALSWPVWTAYEADASWADECALRCMAKVADGNKILPGGKPQARACRHVIDGDNVTGVLSNLRVHIAAVEHVTEAPSQ